MTEDELAVATTAHRKAERLSHALYGLIIVTATLVAEQGHVTEVVDAMGLLLGTALVLLAGADLITLQRAYAGAVVFSLLALFGLGLYEGRTASLGWTHSVLSGAAAGAIGLIVVAVEAFFE